MLRSVGRGGVAGGEPLAPSFTSTIPPDHPHGATPPPLPGGGGYPVPTYRSSDCQRWHSCVPDPMGARALGGQGRGWWLSPRALAAALPPSSPLPAGPPSNYLQAGGESGRAHACFSAAPSDLCLPLCCWTGFRASCLKEPGLASSVSGPLGVPGGSLGISSLSDGPPAKALGPVGPRPREGQQLDPSHPASGLAPRLCVQAPHTHLKPWPPGPP